jgi:uncharacterized protein YhjY with autotransporter beta-barrel domain
MMTADLTPAQGGMTMLKWAGGVLLVSILTFFVAQIPGYAQTLDQQNQALLLSNCAGLSGPGGTYGTNLAAICAAGGAPGGASGGGAASVQASAASILNRSILQRLDESRNEDQSSGQTQVSKMVANPFGVLMPGLFGGMGVTSPSQPTGGPSGGMFGMSSERWKGLGLFASGLVESLNRDITTFQDGYRSTILGFTVGGDYRVSRQLTVGVAYTYSNTSGDFRQGGNFSTNGSNGTFFGQYLPTDRTFVQVTGGYGYNSYLVNRGNNFAVLGPGGINVAGFSSSNSNSDVFRLGMLTGYDHPIGMFTIGPRLGINYSNTHIHSYDEQGTTGLELKFNDQYVNSLQSVLGVQAQAAISTGLGVLVPQVNADYIHEFANSQRFLNVQYVQDLNPTPTKFSFQNDVPVRNYFNVGTGLMMVLPNGWQPFVNFRAMVGNTQFNNYAGMFGLRIEM